MVTLFNEIGAMDGRLPGCGYAALRRKKRWLDWFKFSLVGTFKFTADTIPFWLSLPIVTIQLGD